MKSRWMASVESNFMFHDLTTNCVTWGHTSQKRKTVARARTNLMTQNEMITETSFPYNDQNVIQETSFPHNENSIAHSMASGSTRSRSLPSIRSKDEYELSSCAISCQHQGSPSFTSSGYAKYRPTLLPNRELRTKRNLYTTLFVVATLCGLILLIISLASILNDEDDEQTPIVEEPINELVLVLNTLAPENKPVVISFDGSWKTVHEFQYSQANFQKVDQ